MNKTMNLFKVTHYWKKQIIFPLACLIGLVALLISQLVNPELKFDLVGFLIHLSLIFICSAWTFLMYFGRTTVVFNKNHLLLIERGFPFLNFGCPTPRIDSFSVDGKNVENSDYIEQIFVVMHFDGIENKKVFKFEQEADANAVSEKLNEFLKLMKKI